MCHEGREDCIGCKVSLDAKFCKGLVGVSIPKESSGKTYASFRVTRQRWEQVWVTAGREMEDYSEKCRKECEDRLSGVWSKEDGADNVRKAEPTLRFKHVDVGERML